MLRSVRISFRPFFVCLSVCLCLHAPSSTPGFIQPTLYFTTSGSRKKLYGYLVYELCNKYAGFANNNSHLGKIVIFVTVADFVTKFTVFTEKDSGHTCSKFRHNIWFYVKK